MLNICNQANFDEYFTNHTQRQSCNALQNKMHNISSKIQDAKNILKGNEYAIDKS